MLKIVLSAFTLPLLLLFGLHDGSSSNAPNVAKTSRARQQMSGTLQKMIVASGSVTMDIDMNQIKGVSSTTRKSETAPSRKLSELHFDVAPTSFFPVLVFNKLLRRIEPGSMALVPQTNAALPAVLNASLNRLTIEKAHSGESFDMVVRDAMSGFVFFNITP
jgi:hypothetical protein